MCLILLGAQPATVAPTTMKANIAAQQRAPDAFGPIALSMTAMTIEILLRVDYLES